MNSAKRRGKGRRISHEDYELLYPRFLKFKDVAFIANLKEEYDIDYAYDYLNCEGLLKVRVALSFPRCLYQKPIAGSKIEVETGSSKSSVLYQLLSQLSK